MPLQKPLTGGIPPETRIYLSKSKWGLFTLYLSYTFFNAISLCILLAVATKGSSVIPSYGGLIPPLPLLVPSGTPTTGALLPEFPIIKNLSTAFERIG